MTNLLMVISMLMPQLEALGSRPKDQQVDPKTMEKVGTKIQKIAKGMTPDELVQALGEPSRIEEGYNMYSDKNYVRYFYNDEPCQYHFQSCSVDVIDGKIASFRDVKPAYARR